MRERWRSAEAWQDGLLRTGMLSFVCNGDRRDPKSLAIYVVE